MSRPPTWVRSQRPEPGTLRQDPVAGVPGAIASDPEGMAFAVQVVVNPEQLQNTHRVDLRDAVTVVPASDTILESTQKALRDAEAWLAVHAA